MKLMQALLACLLGSGLAQTSPRAEDIQTTVVVKQLQQNKLQDVTLVKKGQVLVYLISVSTRAEFPAGRLGLKLQAPQGATLLPGRTQVKGYSFRLEYSQDGKTFQKTLKSWKYLRVVVLNPVKAGVNLEVRVFSKVN
ncbi:hypothetical protein [Deinococcus cellulosilyticus]|nr:hypothetical protein [Deinococcus cellulosilyticus]